MTDEFFSLRALQKAALDLHEKVATDLQRTKDEVARLGSDASKKMYSADFLKVQIERERAQGKVRAAAHRAELAALEGRIKAAKAGWTPAALLRRAANEPIEGMAAVTRELGLLRLQADARDADADLLIDLIAENRDAKNIPALMLLQRETSRRRGLDGLTTTAAIDAALEAVGPPGADVAAKFLSAAEQHLHGAEDAAHEMETGTESTRGKMNRVMREQAARKPETV